MDMNEFPGWSTRFELGWRQEVSQHASGAVRVKDFGRPVWQASWTTGQLRPNALDRWRAEIDALSYSLVPFRCWAKSRCWPIAHPGGRTASTSNWVLASGNWNDGGVWSTTAPWTGAGTEWDDITVASIGSDNSSLTLAGADFYVPSVGDMMEIDGHLYRVTGPDINVKPYFWPGVQVGDPVVLHQPSAWMVIVPGSVSTQSGLNGRGVVTFDTVEVVNASDLGG